VHVIESPCFSVALNLVLNAADLEHLCEQLEATLVAFRLLYNPPGSGGALGCHLCKLLDGVVPIARRTTRRIG
jgi:hypothetical protein